MERKSKISIHEFSDGEDITTATVIGSDADEGAIDQTIADVCRGKNVIVNVAENRVAQQIKFSRDVQNTKFETDLPIKNQIHPESI